MQPRFTPDPENPLDRLLAAGAGIDANVALIWSDFGTAVIDTAFETQPAPSLSNQETALAIGQNNLDDGIATPLPAGSAADSVSHDIQDATAPEDGGGPIPVAVVSAPPTSASALAALAVPAIASVGPHVADVSIGDSGAFEALPQASYPIFHAGPAAATPTQVALADSANPAHQTSVGITVAAVGAHGATAAQVKQALDENGLNVSGSGIKVGVLSDSFNDLGGAAADEADGALPSASHVQVLEDVSSGGTDEGRAMMQIIHDIAPNANLAFYTADESEQDFANGILALAAAGCKVICDDVSYFDEPFFQNGVVAQAIQTVEAEGVTYVTSAGNNASNGYQAAWTPGSGSFDGWFFNDAEQFGGSLTQTITVTASSSEPVPLLLEWNEAYGQANFNSGQAPDIDIFVFHNGSLIGQATNASVGEANNPWTGYEFTASGTYQIVIANNFGPDPGLIKEILAGDGLPATISGANTGTVVGHALTPGVITAGAVSAADTPAFGFSPASESFSSSGAGAELLFANNGTALSSPDVLNPVAASGIDDIATTISGNLSDFYGTSAASASLAGVAALLLSANPNLTPAQVEQIIEETALPMSNSAVSGAGLVQVAPAVAAAEALIRIVIESSGSTKLMQIGENYDLDSISSGTGPELQYQGAPVTVGQLGTDVPIGAEQSSSGYDVAFKDSSTGLYTVWATNSSGNYTSSVLTNVAGTNPALESIETTFHQDLNGDGTIGLVGTVIESSGSTSLVETSNNYWLESISGGTGPELKYHGAAVTAGEFGSTVAIGAEQTSTGYDVAWDIPGANEYTVWSVDGNGNYLSNLIPTVAGNNTALEALETTFHQDLNGDGTIGIPTVVIQTDGPTALTEVGNNFFLYNAGTGPELKYHGAAVTPGEFGSTVAIGAVQTSTGYDVAWDIPGANEYTVWSVDSNGNYLSNLIPTVPGNSAALEALETTFHQDLNGDGTIGLVGTVIESFGATSLVEVGTNYYLDGIGGVIGPELKDGGKVVTAGQFGTTVPIGAEQTATGYDVAWKIPSANEYTAWSVDSNGNYISNIIGDVPANSTALEALETTFHQDLNGDGTIGVPTMVIQTNGSIALTEVGNNYFLYDAGTGPELKDGGKAVTAGQFGTTVPIGAVQTATGYDVAWKIPSANEYTVWSVDSNGNYISNIIGDVPANSAALEALETTFHQDLNGDGTIGIPGTFSLQYKGFDYVAFYNGAYENSDSLPSLTQTGANSIEATLDYGIDVATSQVVADPNYTDSLAALGSTIAQAESLGLSVMVRPLIDFLNPSEIAPYSVGDWRQDYQPTNVATFFASYQQMIVQEAQVAQANGAQMLSIGAELDQLTGSQYLSYWTDIITAVRQVFSGALTYSASWDTAGEVSFWSQLNYEGIDNYVPLSNAPTPTLQDLVNGWLEPATASKNPGAYTVIGNQSPIEYFENLSAQSGKPLLFTELGYANDSGAAADPSASGNSPAPTLQAELYQAFFQAWTQSKSTALAGTYFWEWDPNGSTSNVGPNIDSFSPQNSPALNQAIAGFEAVSVPAGAHLTLSEAIGAQGLATIGTGASLELAAADSGSVKFGGPTGILILDHPSTFAGLIFDLTGNGSLSGSDQIDLRDIGFGPGTTVAYTGNTTGGLLTVSDAQHHTASIELAGNYAGSTFSLSSDGGGGTIVIDPPVKQDLAGGTLSFSDPGPTATESVTVSPQNGGAGYIGNFTVDAVTTANGQDSAGWHFNFDSGAAATTVTQSYEVTVADHHTNGTNSTATQSVTVTIAGAGNDAFVFHPDVGADTVVNATSADTIELDGFSSVTSNRQLASLLTEAQAGLSQSLFQTANGGHDTLINLGNHDVITLANVALSALHASDFIIH